MAPADRGVSEVYIKPKMPGPGLLAHAPGQPHHFEEHAGHQPVEQLSGPNTAKEQGNPNAYDRLTDAEIYRNPGLSHPKKRSSYPLPLVLLHHNNSLENVVGGGPLLPPLTTDSSETLMGGSLTSPSFDFDFITKLPTPIVASSGSFSAFDLSPPLVSHALQEAPLPGAPIGSTRKKFPPRNAYLHQAPLRVLSEYRPSLVAERSAFQLQEAIGGEARAAKRFTSNPIREDTSMSPDTTPEELDDDEILLGPKGSAVHTPVASDSFQASPGKDRMEIDQQSAFPTIPAAIYDGTLLPAKYEYVREIGEGLFSKVVLACNTITKEPIAVKVILVPHRSRNEVRNFKSYIKRELQILFSLKHPSIIELVDYKVNLRMNLDTSSASSDTEDDQHANSSSGCGGLARSESEAEFQMLSDTNNNQFMFLKYSPGGNLFEFLLAHYREEVANTRYWQVIERVVCELLFAVAYLHENNVIHRDIKLENILLNWSHAEMLATTAVAAGPAGSAGSAGSAICLTDFGLSKKVKHADELLSTRCGSEDYISPELLMGLNYNGQLTDSWSIGVVVYALLENRLPFDLPPLSTMMNSTVSAGISPSVLKRQRQKNKTPHRIAMIDWGWFKVVDLLNDTHLDGGIKEIVQRLMKLTEKLLVRKQMRTKVVEILADQEFEWVRKWKVA